MPAVHRILIADPIHEKARSLLASRPGFEVTVATGLTRSIARSTASRSSKGPEAHEANADGVTFIAFDLRLLDVGVGSNEPIPCKARLSRGSIASCSRDPTSESALRSATQKFSWVGGGTVNEPLIAHQLINAAWASFTAAELFGHSHV